jgi:hypothetical protein
MYRERIRGYASLGFQAPATTHGHRTTISGDQGAS